MRRYAVQQRKSTKRFDYTCEVSGRVAPAGYCGGWEEPDAGHLARMLGIAGAAQFTRDFDAHIRPHKDKFHAEGHETPEEAVACYRGYLLDTMLRFTPADDEEEPERDVKRKCAVSDCGEFTTGIGHITGAVAFHWPLCKAHRTREAIAVLLTFDELWTS